LKLYKIEEYKIEVLHTVIHTVEYKIKVIHTVVVVPLKSRKYFESAVNPTHSTVAICQGNKLAIKYALILLQFANHPHTRRIGVLE
jgi:hypothetical protein